MEKFFHRFHELFSQLGLRADVRGIEEFLTTHSPLDAEILLADAPFWTEEQAALLKEKILEDADWAEVVDQLNAALRASAPDPSPPPAA